MYFDPFFPGMEDEDKNPSLAPKPQFNINDYLYGYGKSQTYSPLSGINNNQTVDPSKVTQFNPSRNFNQLASTPTSKPPTPTTQEDNLTLPSSKPSTDFDFNAYSKFISLQPKWNNEYPMRWQGIKKIFEDV